MKLNGIIIPALLILCAGCASMKDVVSHRSDAQEETFDISSDQAREIAKTVFRWQGADSVEDVQEIIEAESGWGFISWGDYGGVWITPVDGGHSRVSVYTLRRWPLCLGRNLDDSEFLELFARAVHRVKKGQKLPDERPSFYGNIDI